MNFYETRWCAVRKVMGEQGCGSLILTPGGAMRYLTGFSEIGHERLLALVFPIDQPPLFIVPELNAAQVRENPAEIEAVFGWDDADGWEALLKTIIEDRGLHVGAMAVDDDMPARFTLTIQGLLPSARLQLASPVLTPLRATKDAAERATMQQAAAATDALIPIAFAACKARATELEVALAIQTAVTRAGHALSFDTIVAAGASGASPHHHTGETALHAGDMVVLDFGAQVDGYCGDITRTVAIDHASDEARQVYEVVYQAYCAGVAAVKPGVSGHDVDMAVRQSISEAGFGDYILHRTGHGIGLDCHEAPNIVAGNQAKLEPGQCFSIEPGVYIPKQFGVRLENIVMVAADGTAHVLNTEIPSELPVMES